MKSAATLPINVRVLDVLSRLALSLSLAAGLAWVGLWLVRNPAWSVAALVVRGETANQNEVALRRALKSALSGSFLSLDLNQVRTLMQDVPWVRKATVRRDFPNRLAITVQEHHGVAWWGEAKGTRLVNNYGEIFEASADEADTQQWPVLHGPDERSADVLRAYVGLRDALIPSHLDVRTLSLSAHGNWQAQLEGNTELVLGREAPQDWLPRVQRMTQTLSALRQRYDQALQRIDLRYPNGYAVALHGVSVGPRTNP
jgi:cell division protein FtsQ